MPFDKFIALAAWRWTYPNWGYPDLFRSTITGAFIKLQDWRLKDAQRRAVPVWTKAGGRMPA